ncbi:hypothetical protein AB6A40_006555 [Gnathostoma spinigerum]|uniref:Cytochrome P450 n=1 Tax=Gnathostoma spinigerum TaxID=75299 RepID=A0ABD6EKS4_9BILA
MFLTLVYGIVVALVFYIKFWNSLKSFIVKRWRWMVLMRKLPCPPTYPVIGNLMLLPTSNLELICTVDYVMERYAFKRDDGIVTIWLGPVPIVFLARSTSAKVLLESQNATTKSHEYEILQQLLGQGLITSAGEKWFTRRRMLTPAFHFNILKHFIPIINDNIHQFITILDDLCTENVKFDLFPYLKRLSLDVIAETAMGIKINSLGGENEDYCYATKRIYELMWDYIRFPWLWLKPAWKLSGYEKEFNECLQVAKNMTNKVIREKKREIAKRSDSGKDSITILDDFVAKAPKKRLAFLDLLLEMQHENKLTDEDIREEVDTFMMAGHDTLSSTLGFMLFLLGHEQDVQQKIYEEIIDVLGDNIDGPIAEEDTTKMKFMDMCMKESIRLFPTVPFLGRTISTDMVVGDTVIPAQTTVVVATYAVQRDPLQYERPNEFYPEHFSPESAAKRDPFAFLPFSAGPRNCLGRKFALTEQKLTLASVLRRFKVISVLKKESNFSLPELTLKPSNGFPIRLERRIIKSN